MSEKIEPRWGRIAKVAVIGVENMIANQQAMVIQARASIAGVARMQEGLVRQEGEELAIWEARKAKFTSSLEMMRDDLTQKEYILEGLAEHYKALIQNGLDFLDRQVLDATILEGTNEPKETAGS